MLALGEFPDLLNRPDPHVVLIHLRELIRPPTVAAGSLVRFGPLPQP